MILAAPAVRKQLMLTSLFFLIALVGQTGPVASAQEAPISKPTPATPPGTWAKNEDYPDSAIRAGEKGSVSFTLDVSADGQVTQCTVTESSGSPTLDETACRLMRARASFHPARDATGKAIAARWSSKYRWDLPEIPPIPSTSWHIAAVLKVSATGTVLSCATQSTGPIPSSIAKPCDTFKGSVPPQLFRAIGGAGRPQSLTVEAALTFDDAPSPKLHYLGPGQQLSALVKVAFDVSEVGAVENCRSLPTNQERWLGAQANLCGTLNDSFVAPVGADGKPRRANAVLMTAWSKMR